VRVTGAIGDWSGWHDAWVADGDRYRALAEDAEKRGRTRTAGEAYVRAALYYHYAKFLWLEDLHKYRATTQRSVEMLRKGMSLLDPTFERIEVPLGDGRIVANLRRPQGAPRAPLVLLAPGLDSTKEELPRWEETFLRRGIATASLDGPGQGEAGLDLPMRPDYEVAVTALIEALPRRADLDAKRIGISGVGMGNIYAARSAAYEPRIKAVATIGGPYTYAPTGQRSLRKFMHSARIDDEAAARAFAEKFTLRGVTERLEQPYLVIHGKLDHSFKWQDAERKAKEAKRGEFELFEQGGGVCYSVDFEAKSLLADWMKEKLAA
jgi:dienelactone hydrolase